MKSFLIGVTVGAVVGLLIAPAEGSETRRRLEDKAEELKEFPRRKLREKVEEGREKAGELGREAAERAYDETTKRVIGEI